MTGDRGDPAVRAEQALRREARRRREGRWLLALGLLGAAAAVPSLAHALTGRAGSVVGALILSGLLVGLAVAAWPWTWSAQELEHQRLEAIWAQTRSDAAAAVPWERCAAWAIAEGEQVQLVRLTCAPCTDPAPRRLRSEVMRRVDAAAIADAAEAMEELRRACEERELAARQAVADARLHGERAADDAALAAVDAAAAEMQRLAEEQMRREVQAQDAAERRAQAVALAEALRRP
jgi:hypothetical protein